MDMHPEQDHACGDVWGCREDQAPVAIKDPFSSRKKSKWN